MHHLVLKFGWTETGSDITLERGNGSGQEKGDTTGKGGHSAFDNCTARHSTQGDGIRAETGTQLALVIEGNQRGQERMARG